MPKVEPPEPTRLGEVLWLEPYPDALLEGAIDVPLGPEARYEQQRIDLPRVRDRAADPAAAPARRAGLARRPRFPGERGGRHARRDGRIGQQRAEAGARRLGARADVPTATASDSIFRGRDRGEVRPRVGVRRSRRAGGPADRRRLHVDAADALRIRGPRRRCPFRARASSTRVAGSTSCRRAPTVSPRSAPTCGPQPASATGPASTSSPSPATRSAP